MAFQFDQPFTGAYIQQVLEKIVTTFGGLGIVKANGTTLVPATEGTDFQSPSLKGQGAPTTAGIEGQFYTDTDTNTLYQYVNTAWESVGGGGAGTMYSASVGTTWTKDATANWYTQTVSVAGITSSDRPDVDVDLSSADTSEDVEAMLTAWGNIFRVVTSNGSITIYSSQATETAITISLRC